MWKRNQDSDSLIFINRDPFISDERFGVAADGWDLTITNVEGYDSGEYICELSTSPQMKLVQHLEVLGMVMDLWSCLGYGGRIDMAMDLKAVLGLWGTEEILLLKKTFLVPPTVSIEPDVSPHVAKPGEGVQFTCYGAGNPQPTITWRRVVKKNFIG